MPDASEDETVTIELDRHEALVLLEWLDRSPDPGGEDPAPLESAVRRIRWDIECVLEASLVAPFQSDYDEQMQAAIDAVRDEVREDFEREQLVLPATDEAMAVVSWLQDRDDTHVESVDYGEQTSIDFYGTPEALGRARAKAREIE